MNSKFINNIDFMNISDIILPVIYSEIAVKVGKII